jgi:hypothetical protein
MDHDKLRRRPADCAAEARTVFVPMHLQPAFFGRLQKQRHPVAEQLRSAGLYRLSSARLTDAEIGVVRDVIHQCRCQARGCIPNGGGRRRRLSAQWIVH